MDSEQYSVSPESVPVPEQFGVSPDAMAKPEQGAFENGAEKFEQRSEGAPGSAGPVVLPQVVVNNTTAPAATGTQAADTASSNNPVTAKDGDSMEKEWVNRIKQVLKETKDNPYEKEEEVKELKVDYLDKRYGRKLGGGD